MAEQAGKRLPLVGVRVLDFTHAAAGPYTTMFLGDMGAEVIKVEKPGRGDGSRYMAEPMLGPIDSDYYLSLNRNKQGVCLDLQTPEGVDLARRLAAVCDLVVQNFRPGVMDRLGLGFEDLRKVRKGLVYGSISAFGSTGPMKDQPGNDIIMQSVSGLMGITGEPDGGPVRIGAAISDYSSGLFALSGLLAALFARDQHPEGQHVDVAMLDASIAMMCNYIPSVVALGKRIPRLGRGHAQIVPYQAFLCADNEYVMVGAFTQGFWQRLAVAVGHAEWVADPRFVNNAARLRNRKELMPELERIFAAKPRAEWMEILRQADVPTSPVLELHDALKQEQAIHNQIVMDVCRGEKSVPMVRFPVRVAQWAEAPARVSPRMGEDTETVLSGLLHLTQAEMKDLADRRVIAFLEEGDRPHG